VKLSENPIFLTHKRLVHRAGVLAAMLIAGLVGFSLLLGLIHGLEDDQWRPNHTPQESGRAVYGWIIGIEILVLVIGGFSRVARVVSDDRKAGLWDSNRLTPLKASQIVAGYWFAPALREFYMVLMLAAFGLVITIVGKLPLTFWLGTQILVASTALFFGLLGVLTGMIVQRSQGILVFLAMLGACPLSFFAPSRLVTNFLLPIYGLGYSFSTQVFGELERSSDWTEQSTLFGVPVPPVLLSLGLQFILGIFVWRALVRKTANPFQPLLLRWEASTLFGILILFQHALMWSVWRGGYPDVVENNYRYADRHEGLMGIVHGGTLLMGLLLILFASPQPEQVRVQSLRLGFKGIGGIFSRSAVSLALLLAGIAGAGMFLEFMFTLPTSWPIFIALLLHVLVIFLMVALLLEFCRLRHRRRALGFFALWAFALCIIPFILAALLHSEGLAHISLLAPGFFALGDRYDQDWPLVFWPLAGHCVIVVFVFIAWCQQWKQLLARAN
jgi:hypothetical protein